MKKIKKVNIWNNGIIKKAIYIDIFVNNLDLNNSANISYKLLDQSGEILVIGNLFINGQDYQDWSSDDYVWDWAAKQLNIEYDLDNSVDSNS